MALSKTTSGGLGRALHGVGMPRLPFARLLWLTLFLACVIALPDGFARVAAGFASTVDAQVTAAVADRDLSGDDAGSVLQQDADAVGDDVLAAPDEVRIAGAFAASGSPTIAWRATSPATMAAGARAPPPRG